jgi:hypothetical protein
MSDSVYSVAGLAVGAGTGFELTLKGESGEQKFAVAIDDIPLLVQQLTAIAWASAASNRPAAGTVLPTVHAFPVKGCEVGFTEDRKDPVMMIELFGGVKFGLHFTPEAARTAATELTRMGAPGPGKQVNS